MFKWISKIFFRKKINSQINDDEKRQFERITSNYKDNSNLSDYKKMLINDFERRMQNKENGGSSSSPISSP